MGVSERQFEMSIGVSNGYINKAPRTLSNEMALRIIEKFPKFNKTWLILGEGDMYVSRNKYDIKEEVLGSALSMASEEYAPYEQINTYTQDHSADVSNPGDSVGSTVDIELFELLKTALKESQRSNERMLKDNKLMRNDIEALKKQIIEQHDYIESLNRDNARLKEDVNILRKKLG